ncbi:MAG: 16S rRNA (adenine(1518)-N(6)/adenine(1519)-N(6))-dimethyltransferase RsmA [Gaiellales bacterium]
MSRTTVRSFLDRHGLLARKDLGQNFLVEDHVAERLADLAGVEAGGNVIEIGTGTGVLTAALAARAARVVTLDIDAGLVRALRAERVFPEHVELLHQDVLKADLAGIAADFDGPVRLVSNLPYSISGPVLRRLLDLRDVLADWSVMVQREVGLRLLASPGTRSYGSLTVLHRLCVRPERLMDLEPGGFFPTPRVRSSFIRLFPLAPSIVPPGGLERVERVVRAAFRSRRKTLKNALRSGGLSPAPSEDAVHRALEALGLDERARGETLVPEQFLELTRALAAGSASGRRFRAPE